MESNNEDIKQTAQSTGRNNSKKRIVREGHRYNQNLCKKSSTGRTNRSARGRIKKKTENMHLNCNHVK